MTPIVIDYDVLCSAVEKAERRRGKVQVVRFRHGYEVEFSIERILVNFWVRKVRIEVRRGSVHPGAIQLLTRAFKIPVNNERLQELQGRRIVEMYTEAGNEQNYSQCG